MAKILHCRLNPPKVICGYLPLYKERRETLKRGSEVSYRIGYCTDTIDSHCSVCLTKRAEQNLPGKMGRTKGYLTRNSAETKPVQSLSFKVSLLQGIYGAEQTRAGSEIPIGVDRLLYSVDRLLYWDCTQFT